MVQWVLLPRSSTSTSCISSVKQQAASGGLAKAREHNCTKIKHADWSQQHGLRELWQAANTGLDDSQIELTARSAPSATVAGIGVWWRHFSNKEFEQGILSSPPPQKSGWLEYDKWFRQQQAAMTVPHPWNELNASMHAATVMSRRSGPHTFCNLCKVQNLDHDRSQCALAYLQSPQLLLSSSVTAPPPASRCTRLDLDRICSSWNKGCCVFPSWCRFRHMCYL